MRASAAGNFGILVCIDGSDESLGGLEFALRLAARGHATDIAVLMPVAIRDGGASPAGPLRTRDQDERTLSEAGLQAVDIAALLQARDRLITRGFLKQEWLDENVDRSVQTDGPGASCVRYTGNRTGQVLSLVVRETNVALLGILAETRFHRYDVVIVAATSPDAGGRIHTRAAIGVASEHDGTVILVRCQATAMVAEQGQLVCLVDSDISAEEVDRMVRVARRCGSPIHLFAAAADEYAVNGARRLLDWAAAVVEESGVDVSGRFLEQGDPVEGILARGRNRSLIVLSGRERSAFTGSIAGSVADAVLKKARGSVMIVR
jgi:nucleotide-binding universal stress UspA family protein